MVGLVLWPQYGPHSKSRSPLQGVSGICLELQVGLLWETQGAWGVSRVLEKMTEH